MSDPTARTRSTSALWTHLLAAFSLFAATLVARTVEWFFKSTNPDAVDVTQGLAYLRPVLITAGVLVALAVIATLVAILQLRRKEGAHATAIPWVLFGVQVLLWLATTGVGSAISSIVQPG